MNKLQNIRPLALLGALCLGTHVVAAESVPSDAKPAVIVDTRAEPVTPGKFKPTWESLSQYEVPGWFRDAKFGIWAHWGPQCEPEASDWYARLPVKAATCHACKLESTSDAASPRLPSGGGV